MTKPNIEITEGVDKGWKKLFDALNHEEATICVVVAASYIDFTLIRLLKGYFIVSTKVDNILSHNGALRDLMSRANIAYCVGLISKDERHSIEHIAHIRNKFAHNIDITFSDSEVEKWCDEIRSPIFTIPDSHLANSLKTIKEGGAKDPSRTRSRFMLGAAAICTHLGIEALTVKRCDAHKQGATTYVTATGEQAHTTPPDE